MKKAKARRRPAAREVEWVYPFQGWTGDFPATIETLPAKGLPPQVIKVQANIASLTKRMADIMKRVRSSGDTKANQYLATLFRKNQRLQTTIKAIRATILGPHLKGCKLPLSRQGAGLHLPDRIRELELEWFRQHRVPSDAQSEYEDAILDLREGQQMELGRSWDPFFRICVWFDSPAEPDIPSGLPVRFDESRWQLVLESEGQESNSMLGYAAKMCRLFLRWRRLLKRMPLPHRQHYNSHLRRWIYSTLQYGPQRIWRKGARRKKFVMDLHREYNDECAKTGMKQVTPDVFRKAYQEVKHGKRHIRYAPPPSDLKLLQTLTIDGRSYLCSLPKH